MDKKVTGCIVTYNNIRTIGKAIDSLLKNTHCDFRLIIVDNGSTDGTKEFIKEKYPSLELIETEKNIGFGAGHNLIIDSLDSEYHAIINPDIILRDDVISDMAGYLEEHPEAGMLSPKIEFPDGRPQILGKRIPKPHYLVASRLRGREPGRLLREYAMLDEDLSSPCRIENATGCFMLIRTSLFREIGGFDKRYFMYFEDCDLTRTVNSVSQVLYYPYATVYHEWGRESKKNFRLKVIQIQSMLRYYKKWGI